MQLTDRYKEALSFAFDLHKDDRRKGKETPYMAHLLSVSAMVMDDGGTEDDAIGALLHDTLEDHPDLVTQEILVLQFGKAVADIVQGCTDRPDGFQCGEKPPWKDRKVAYINHLKDAPPSVLRVAIADKLHNARELLSDLKLDGEATIDRFNVGWEDQVWYLGELLTIFNEKMQGSLHLDGFRKGIRGLKGALGLS